MTEAGLHFNLIGQNNPNQEDIFLTGSLRASGNLVLAVLAHNFDYP